MRNIVVAAIAGAMFLSGCSVLSVGADQTFVEEYGYNLEDAGALWHPWLIIQDKEGANEAAYKHVELGNGGRK
jgi:hypothetical protein